MKRSGSWAAVDLPLCRSAPVFLPLSLPLCDNSPFCEIRPLSWPAVPEPEAYLCLGGPCKSSGARSHRPGHRLGLCRTHCSSRGKPRRVLTLPPVTQPRGPAARVPRRLCLTLAREVLRSHRKRRQPALLGGSWHFTGRARAPCHRALRAVGTQGTVYAGRSPGVLQAGRSAPTFCALSGGPSAWTRWETLRGSSKWSVPGRRSVIPTRFQ